MMKRVVVILSLACVMFLQPKTSEAGLADFIWGLSGPQLVGLGFGCRWEFAKPPILESCVVGSGLTPDAEARAATGPPTWLFSVGGTVYRSTGKDGEQKENGQPGERYAPGDVYMLAAEPGLALRYRFQGIRAYSGAGLTLNYFFGSRQDVPGRAIDDATLVEALRFKPFFRAGIKVTFLEVKIPKVPVTIGANARFYPKGFTDSDFRPGPSQHSETRGLETVLGTSINIQLK